VEYCYIVVVVVVVVVRVASNENDDGTLKRNGSTEKAVGGKADIARML